MGDPVDFPVLATVVRERLLEMGRRVPEWRAVAVPREIDPRLCVPREQEIQILAAHWVETSGER
jgi:hypothetical protein